MIKISNISYYFPQKSLSNADLEKEFPEWSAVKIEEKVGIKNRFIVDENVTALDLAENACNKLFENYEKSKIDFVLLCTQSPDYFLPTSACILQDKLHLSKNIGALDFNLGCSGFVYGLAVAKGLISANIAKNVLLVTSETYSKHLDKKDKANRSIFGDGACATVVEKDSKGFNYKFSLGTDGSGYDNLIVKNGAFKCSKNESEDDFLYMNGPEIFNFTIENIPNLVKETISNNKLTENDIDFYIFHQANTFMLNYLRKKCKISEEKFYIDMENYGNTVSSTIPIALKDCIENKLVKKGDKILIAGFGVGYSWGATIIEI